MRSACVLHLAHALEMFWLRCWHKAFAWLGGIILGVVATLPLTRLFASMLYDETPTDITTIVILALLLSSVALMACYIPALRATKVDPLIALRSE